MIIHNNIPPHQWYLFSNSLACDMWTSDFYDFLSKLDGEYE